MKERPYQANASNAILDAFEHSQTTLLVLPTGTGKTVVFSHIVNAMKEHGRCMVIAHREELITQAAKKLWKVTGVRPDVEMNVKYADEHGFLGDPVDIVVASVQTLNSGRDRPRYKRFDPNFFKLLVIDEAHHAPAQSYRRVINHFRQNPDLRVLGVTATPDRSDQKALGQVFGSVAYEYGILDAINDGWLVPIHQQFIQCSDLDFSGIRTTAGDLNGKDLAEVLEEERILHEMVGPTIEIIGDRKTLFFAQSVAQAERTAEIFNRHRSGMAECVFGHTPKDDRKDRFMHFGSRFQVLVNVGVTTEGFDDPDIEVVACGRPTKSRALYAQIIGRGTRPLDGLVDPFETAEERRRAIAESRKQNVLVLDFAGNSGHHKLVSVGDVLGGEYTDEEIEWAKKEVVDNRGSADMAEELKKAKKAVDEEKRRQEEERRRRVRAKARYRAREVDAFSHGDRFRNERPKPQRHWYFTPATPKQVAVLEKKGITVPPETTVADASKMIDQIANNGWRVPPELEHLRRGKAS